MEEDILKRKESEEGRMIHKLAEEEREHGDLEKARKLHNKAILAYERDGDYLGWAEGLSGKVIDLRHLARQNKDRNLLIEAEQTAKEAVEISGKSGIEEASTIPFFGLATVQEELGNFNDAVKSYSEAVKRPLPIRHNTPAFRANMQIHLAVCEYKAGDKDALVRAEEWLGKLEQAEHPNKYEHDVWLSGGHMRIAEAIIKDDAVSAVRHLQFARGIINSNPQLTLRKEQLEEISKKIDS